MVLFTFFNNLILDVHILCRGGFFSRASFRKMQNLFTLKLSSFAVGLFTIFNPLKHKQLQIYQVELRFCSIIYLPISVVRHLPGRAQRPLQLDDQKPTGVEVRFWDTRGGRYQ